MERETPSVQRVRSDAWSSVSRACASHPALAPVGILDNAVAGRLIIQDFRPFCESLEWELGLRYYENRGSRAFLHDPMPIPYAVNNDGNFAVAAAQLLFQSVRRAERTGHHDSEILVLEIGMGLGLFARYFLDSFRELSQTAGRDYYDRLCYIASDFSERMLVDMCTHGVLSNHAGHYRLRIIDAADPLPCLLEDAAFSLRRNNRPLIGVFLNYLLDSLPVAVLQVRSGRSSQLCVRTCLARGAALGPYTNLSVEDLAARAGSPVAAERAALADLFGLFVSEYDFQPVDLARLPYTDLIGEIGLSADSYLVHNYGALKCLDELSGLLDDQGFILVNDYGSAEAAVMPEGFEHQRFSGSTAVGVNFALLKAHFAHSAGHRWVEPAEDNPRIYSRLLGRDVLDEETVRFFQERFGKAAYEALHSPAETARALTKSGRYEAAAGAYREALRRESKNWILLEEVSQFLTFTLKEPVAGLEMARAGLALNPTCSAELWNSVGDSLFLLGRVEEARDAFLRALVVNPNDVRARYNLTCVHAYRKDAASALGTIAQGLSIDERGAYREGFLRMQAEVLAQMTERYEQDTRLLVNRVRKVGSPIGNEDRLIDKPGAPVEGKGLFS